MTDMMYKLATSGEQILAILRPSYGGQKPTSPDLEANFQDASPTRMKSRSFPTQKENLYTFIPTL